MSRLSKTNFYRNLKREHNRKLNEEYYESITTPQQDFADTDIDMENIPLPIPMSDTSIQFEPEEDTNCGDQSKNIDMAYIKQLIGQMKCDLDNLATEAEAIDITCQNGCEYNFSSYFKNHEIVKALTDASILINEISSSVASTNKWTKEQEQAQEQAIAQAVKNQNVQQSPEEGNYDVIISDIIADYGC